MHIPAWILKDDTFLFKEQTESINKYLKAFTLLPLQVLALPKSSITDGTHYHTMTAPCCVWRSDTITPLSIAISVSSRQFLNGHLSLIKQT